MRDARGPAPEPKGSGASVGTRRRARRVLAGTQGGRFGKEGSGHPRGGLVQEGRAPVEMPTGADYRAGWKDSVRTDSEAAAVRRADASSWGQALTPRSNF